MEAGPTTRTPVATYRLQLTPSFTFEDAAAAVPYLAGLGVSHIYLSPVFAAAPGSEHGYDVLDHGRISDELGGIAGLYKLKQAADSHGLGLIFDIVPNHVGLAGGHNRWWRDVMREGQDSAYAAYFDIDWDGQPYLPAGVLVYPILGRPCGETLEAGELTLERSGGQVVIRYYDHTFPVTPKAYASILGLPPVTVTTHDPAALATLAETLDGLSHAPASDHEALLARLGQLIASEPGIAAFVDEQVAGWNGRPGDPASFDRLDELLSMQAYRLASWRVSGEEINYRRFFDINDLAAIRVEHPPVFDEVHHLVRELAAGGIVAGLRVDHIDGLYDPESYLRKLNDVLNGEGASAADARPIYVEKILGWDEQLPQSWQVAGTTGYEALARFDRVNIDPAGETLMTDIYKEFTGRTEDFARVAFGTRRRIAERTFAGEVNVLANHLYRIAQGERRRRDITLRGHHDAIAAFVACLPVYRTYLSDGQPQPIDTKVIEETSALAAVWDPNAGRDALEFLCEVLLLRGLDGRPDEWERRMHFRRRLEQLSSPVMAKGVEDTAFYRYNRLLSLNEVGSSPGVFGASLGELHSWFGQRAASWPGALSATTTHDTKRSEDARARLSVLSEIPREWRREVRAWARSNARFKSLLNGMPTPGPNLEYYYYQTLIAAWDGMPTASFRERMAAHMTKAMREAKEETAWTRINEPYEEAVLKFVKATLDRRRARAFLERMARFSQRIALAARQNSLGMVTLKTMAPGVPDFYQGSEGELTTLTDPDNRRPVDFRAMAEAAAQCTGGWDDGFDLDTAKRWLTRRLLDLRRRKRELFRDGAYEALNVEGELADHVFAFRRTLGEESVVVVIPRIVARLPTRGGRIEPAAWADTTVIVPGGTRSWTHTITDELITTNGVLAVGELLSGAPVGVVEQSEEAS